MYVWLYVLKWKIHPEINTLLPSVATMNIMRLFTTDLLLSVPERQFVCEAITQDSNNVFLATMCILYMLQLQIFENCIQNYWLNTYLFKESVSWYWMYIKLSHFILSYSTLYRDVRFWWQIQSSFVHDPHTIISIEEIFFKKNLKICFLYCMHSDMFRSSTTSYCVCYLSWKG